MNINKHKETTDLLLFSIILYITIISISFIICKLYEKFI